MSYANPNIPIIEDAIGLDRIIQELQEDLSTLPWLEKSFGRAWKFAGEPKAYDGAGEYISVAPNDHFRAQSFIAAEREEETVDYLPMIPAIDMERRLNVIFWVNLKEIDENKDYIFTELLKKDVLKVLKASPHVKSINYYTDEDAYAGYKVVPNSLNAEKALMHPFAGMKFNITVAYLEEC